MKYPSIDCLYKDGNGTGHTHIMDNKEIEDLHKLLELNVNRIYVAFYQLKSVYHFNSIWYHEIQSFKF
jgi:hypothetical protein